MAVTGNGTARTVLRQVTGRPTQDGAGVKLVRVLGSPTIHDFDPFLMLDAFDSTNPDDYTRGFPLHPHRGIETVTYLIHGTIEHQDSLGNKGVIEDGGCQWMTAGHSIMHQEMPKSAPRMLGLQLWVNLPKKDKMCPPKYREITADMLPRIEEPGAAVAVLAGSYKGKAGAIQTDYVTVTFLDITLQPGATLTIEIPHDDTAFAYLFSGDCSVTGTPLAARQANLFSQGDFVTFQGGKEAARIVFVSGAPLREPVAWGGPIVMNTEEELKQAFLELEAGTFSKHASKR